MYGPGKFRFLNQVGQLGDLGWDNPTCEKLWRYNLHYFDDLNAEGADERNQWHIELLENWISANPPGRGTGWEPYPTSLRIVNWLKWRFSGHELPSGCAQNLAVQVRWLSRRLEWHLLGNHLFANAKALVFAGLAFEGNEAEHWLRTGLRLINAELAEQVLLDGANFELSPMYHAIFLEDVLDLINAARAWPGRIDARMTKKWLCVAAKMLGWLEGMTHPDGEIALFNDAAIGIAPAPHELASYAKRLDCFSGEADGVEARGIVLQAWTDSGYIRLQSPAAVALLDVARVGPDYLPGHAHADTLSFELSLFEQRVIVNGGTSRYGTGPERLKERETVSHSTVEVDGKSSSEVWGGFRVARRASPFDLYWKNDGDYAVIACSHDGYTRLPGAPVHRREWQMRPGELEVIDLITGQYERAVARYILHPDVNVVGISDDSFVLGFGSGRSVRFNILDGHGRIEESQYSAEFGMSVHTTCIVIELHSGRAHMNLKWG